MEELQYTGKKAKAWNRKERGGIAKIAKHFCVFPEQPFPAFAH
jgi:hypothetical protein